MPFIEAPSKRTAGNLGIAHGGGQAVQMLIGEFRVRMMEK